MAALLEGRKNLQCSFRRQVYGECGLADSNNLLHRGFDMYNLHYLNIKVWVIKNLNFPNSKVWVIDNLNLIIPSK